MRMLTGGGLCVFLLGRLRTSPRWLRGVSEHPAAAPVLPATGTLQEVAAEDDDEYVAAINLALNMDVDGGEDGGEGMQADAGAPAAAGTPAQPGGVAPSPAAAITSSQLAAALGSILAGSAGQQGDAGTHQQQMQQAAAAAASRGPSLADVLNPELLAPLLQSPDMVQRLAPYLPEQHRWVLVWRVLTQLPSFVHIVWQLCCH